MTKTKRKCEWVVVDGNSGEVKGEFESQLEASYCLATDMRCDYGHEAEGWMVDKAANWVGIFIGGSFGRGA